MKRRWLIVSWGVSLGILTVLRASASAAEMSTSDCLVASDTSLKYDNEHRLRAERAELLLCAAASCPADIRKECVRRVEEVNAAIPSVVFVARDSAGNDLTLVKVTMDQEVVADRLEGIPVAVDPGPHTFSFELVGHATLRKTLVIRQGHKNRTELISFEADRKSTSESTSGLTAAYAKAPVQPSSGVAWVASSSQPSGPPRAQPESALGAQRTLAVASVVVGALGVGAGAVFGIQAVSKRDKAQAACPEICGDQNGVTLWQEAKQSGNRATGAFIVGGVGLVGAAILWLTGGSSSVAAGTEVGPGEVKMAVTGRW